jgi:hypothetical protein
VIIVCSTVIIVCSTVIIVGQTMRDRQVVFGKRRCYPRSRAMAREVGYTVRYALGNILLTRGARSSSR